ncbi:MAG: hypothetical protein PHC94_08090 [Methylobacter sp.]|nr:hypothetical protein [Methylobacter sp.]
MPQFVKIPTIANDQNSRLIEVYSSMAGAIPDAQIKLSGKNISSITLGLMPHGLATTGQDVVDRVRIFLMSQHLNADWIDAQRLYSIGRCEGDSIKLGLAIALLLHDQHDQGSDIIATGTLGGHKGQITVEPVSQVAEKFQLVLQERQANTLDAKHIVFFTPTRYLDNNGNQQPISDFQHNIDQLAAVGIEVKPIDHLIDIFAHLHIAIPDYPQVFAGNTETPPALPNTANELTALTITSQNQLLTPKKTVFALSAIAALVMACTMPITRHHKIGAFEQLSQYTLLDKFQQWGEKIASYQHQKPLSVMVIYSEKAPYEEAIVNSLFEHLDNKVWHLEQAVHDEPFVGPDGTKDIANWQKKIDKIIQRTFSHKVDYLVTVGTNVTIAIRDAKLADKFNAKGVIFLGLTDPVKAGIVKSLNDRHEDTKITGVRYGTDNEDDYGKTIGALFPPQQKLVFVYNKHTIQDLYVDQNLSNLKEKTNDVRFESRPKDGDITLNDLTTKQAADPQEVYFAWYGLDNVLRDNEKDDGLAALKTKWVIPSTYSTDNLEKAGVVVSVSDQEVGRLGAEIIFKSYLNPDLKLGEEPVATTPFVAWLDCEVIRQNKVGLRLATPIPETAQITNKDACASLTQ